MKIEVKLYFYHDMDLVTLYRSKALDFPEGTRAALNAYAQNRALRFEMHPKERKEKDYEYRKYFHYFVTLDEEKDKAAVDLIRKINFGYRNNFVKTILRQYICASLPAEYLTDGDQEYLDSRSETLGEGRETVRPEREKKERKPKAKKAEQTAKPIKPEKEEPKTAPDENDSEIDSFLSSLTPQY